jgi:hypothetical protein
MLRYLLTALDKYCEAFIQELPDAKLLIDLMGSLLENIVKRFSDFTNKMELEGNC